MGNFIYTMGKNGEKSTTEWLSSSTLMRPMAYANSSQMLPITKSQAHTHSFTYCAYTRLLKPEIQSKKVVPPFFLCSVLWHQKLMKFENFKKGWQFTLANLWQHTSKYANIELDSHISSHSIVRFGSQKSFLFGIDKYFTIGKIWLLFCVCCVFLRSIIFSQLNVRIHNLVIGKKC